MRLEKHIYVTPSELQFGQFSSAVRAKHRSIATANSVSQSLFTSSERFAGKRIHSASHDRPMTAPDLSVPADTKNVLREAIAAHGSVPGGLLPLLHHVQDALGYVPSEAVPQIAEALNLSRAEVHGVVTYYHHFRATPPGRNLIQLCRAEACQARGADALLAHVSERIGCALHATSADGGYSLEPAYCLGLCASSPALVWNDELHARVTPERFDQLVADSQVQP
jgi:formate dehydrogenase subunit gamma